MIEHLQLAMVLAAEVSQPTTAYLIGRALDEARAADWGRKPYAKD
jgi:hypothetical protein